MQTTFGLEGPLIKIDRQSMVARLASLFSIVTDRLSSLEPIMSGTHCRYRSHCHCRSVGVTFDLIVILVAQVGVESVVFELSLNNLSEEPDLFYGRSDG